MIRWTILLSATLWAYWPQSHLKRYFLAQLLYSVVLETIVLTGHDETTHLYHLAYYYLTLLILAAMLEVTLIYVNAHPTPGMLSLTAISIAIATFALAYSGLSKPLHGYDRFMLVEATTLLFCGAVLGLASAWIRGWHKPVAASLAVLWIALACFRYGFNLNLPHPAWIKMNLWVPYWMACSEFAYLGFKFRRINATHG